MGIFALHLLGPPQPPLGVGVEVGKRQGQGQGGQVPFQEIYLGGSQALSAQPQDAAAVTAVQSIHAGRGHQLSTIPKTPDLIWKEQNPEASPTLRAGLWKMLVKKRQELGQLSLCAYLARTSQA